MLLAAVSCNDTARAQVANVVQDNFSGNNAQLPWVATGGACLTAGDASTVVSSGIGIPACGDHDYVGQTHLGGVSGTLPDPIGQGALRLTNDDNVFVQGGVIDTQAFPTNQGIQITFTTYTYDALQGGSVREYNDGTCQTYAKNTGTSVSCTNHGGDGMTFFLLSVAADASGNPKPVDMTSLPTGGAGGSLNYSCNNRNFPNVDGMPSGYIGLGIDDGGFYLDSADNTASHLAYQIPNTIGLRGAGNVNWAGLNAAYPNYYPSSLSSSQRQQAVANTCRTGYLWNYANAARAAQTTTPVAFDYNYLASATMPTSTPIANVNATQRGSAYPITYRLIITPDNKLSLDYNWKNAGFANILPPTSITASNGPLPTFFRFGFAAAAGGASNIHEISCFQASPAARSAGAPAVPISISTGGHAYTLTNNPSQVQGYVTAYGLTSSGAVSSTSSWEAGALMTDAKRQGGLYSTSADGSTVALLTDLETATSSPFVTTTCAPSAATIVGYTVDPGSVSPPRGCAAYLGTRKPGALLAGFSANDAAAMLLPPHNVLDFVLPGYTAFAKGAASRASALLFTNDDGFLYSIDASTGALNWGWMPRSFVSQLQNYTTWPYQDNFAGNFAIVDAYDTSATPAAWGTYVIGSANGGALWYDLALDADGKPARVVTTFGPSQTTMPNNTQALPAGSLAYSHRQAPIVGNVGGRQIAAFVVNATSGSTTTSQLIEFDVATGHSSSAAISASAIGTGSTVTSNLYYDATAGELFLGTSAGKVYVTSYTGDASMDASNVTLLGTTQDGLAVNYVGYQQLQNLPYLWAASSSGLTVFGIKNASWGPLWASSGGSAQTYANGAWTTTSSGKPAAMQSGAQISDLPVVINGTLVVPVYLPATATGQTCNISGEAFYDLFSLQTGAFPLNTVSVNGVYITSNVDFGQGSAFSPNFSVSGSGIPLYGGSTQTPISANPLVFSRSGINTVVQWRVQ